MLHAGVNNCTFALMKSVLMDFVPRVSFMTLLNCLKLPVAASAAIADAGLRSC